LSTLSPVTQGLCFLAAAYLVLLPPSHGTFGLKMAD
jgi:hypothetical protein